MIKYKHTSSNKRIKTLAQESISARLFVNGWHLRSVLKGKYPIKRISVAYDDSTPIGCAVLSETYKDFIMVFVRKKYRRLGIGSRLIKLLKADNPLAFIGKRNGDEHRAKFYNKCIGKYERYDREYL